MNRRQILSIGLCSAVLPLSGCYTTRLHENTSYGERISGVFISSDKKTLAIIGTKYHYLIEAPAAIIAALDPRLHPSITSASFESFIVDGSNNLTGTVRLIARAPSTEVQKQLAIQAGFTLHGNDELFVQVPIHGVRYTAKPLGNLAEEKLNKEYFIWIKELPSLAERGLRIAVTPITIAADGALILGFVLLSPLWIPLLRGKVIPK